MAVSMKAYIAIYVTFALALAVVSHAQDVPTSELGETPPLGTNPTAVETGITPEQITALQGQVSDLIQDYLAQRGWQHNCDAPGGCWLWEKTIKGQSYRMNTDEAMNVEFVVEFAEREELLRLSVSP